MSMKIYNTLSKQKEDFVPIEEGKVRMYVCTSILLRGCEVCRLTLKAGQSRTLSL